MNPIVSGILGLFTKSNPVAEIMSEVDKLHVSAEEKGTLRKEAVVSLLELHSNVIMQEYQNGTWLSRSWRPLTMLSFVGVVLYTNFLGPMFELKTVTLDPEMWLLIKIGLGGYLPLRSVEKLAGTIVPNMKLAKMKKKLLKQGLDATVLD